MHDVRRETCTKMPYSWWILNVAPDDFCEEKTLYVVNLELHGLIQTLLALHSHLSFPIFPFLAPFA